MKPAWDKLMDAYADNPSILIADVDCTADGKTLCTKEHVRGYPTIKYGDPNSMEQYKGARDYGSLKKFAEENLKPICSPFNMDVCTDDMKDKIKEYQAMSREDLAAEIYLDSKKLSDEETRHQKEIQELNDKFSAFQSEWSATIALKKSVQAHAAAEKAKTEEVKEDL